MQSLCKGIYIYFLTEISKHPSVDHLKKQAQKNQGTCLELYGTWQGQNGSSDQPQIQCGTLPLPLWCEGQCSGIQNLLWAFLDVLWWRDNENWSFEAAEIGAVGRNSLPFIKKIF